MCAPSNVIEDSIASKTSDRDVGRHGRVCSLAPRRSGPHSQPNAYRSLARQLDPRMIWVHEDSVLRPHGRPNLRVLNG